MVSKKEKKTILLKRGEIWIGRFDKLKEFSKDYRPVLIISNNWQNEFDDKVIIVPLTTDKLDNIKPFEYLLKKDPENGLDQDSKILLCYPYAIEKDLRLDYQIGVVNDKIMAEIKKVWELAISW